MNDTILEYRIGLDDHGGCSPTGHECTAGVGHDRDRLTALRGVVTGEQVGRIDDGPVDDVVFEDSEDLGGVERGGQRHGRGDGCCCRGENSESQTSI